MPTSNGTLRRLERAESRLRAPGEIGVNIENGQQDLHYLAVTDGILNLFFSSLLEAKPLPRLGWTSLCSAAMDSYPAT